MSLTINEGGVRKAIPVLPEGTYAAVCCMMIDMGNQYREAYDNTQHKVKIGWEIPSEALEDGTPRYVFKEYTASLNAKGNLRKDLEAWRGRKFTVDELKGFSLKNIVGVPCFVNITVSINQTTGKSYNNVSGIVALPKGMPPVVMSEAPVIYDIDEDDPSALERVPAWIADKVKESEDYKRKTAQAEQAAPAPNTNVFSALDDADGELPF